MSDLARKATLTLGSVILFGALISMVSHKKEFHDRTMLEEFFQTDAGQFKKYFGFEPEQPTTELHAIVQDRVTKKTIMLWCAYYYRPNQDQRREKMTKTHEEMNEADRAADLAFKFGYTPALPNAQYCRS